MEDNRCIGLKADGTRCGRPVTDVKLCACKLHVDTLRRQRDFELKHAEEAAERERQAELELQQARQRKEDELPDTKLDLESLFGNRAPAINIEIGDGPAVRRVDPAETGEDLVAKAAAQQAKQEAQAAREALKPAKWAATQQGLNQKKGWGGAVDKTGLEDCPVCLEEKADVKMEPCGHTCCGSCLDQWMSTKSSFAQTLRTGSSDTTCPLCRAAVSETVAATPGDSSDAPAVPAGKADADDDEQDWVALAKQRHAEVIAKARAKRNEMADSPGPEPTSNGNGHQGSGALGPSALADGEHPSPVAVPKTSNASKWGINTAPGAPGGSSNGASKGSSPWGASSGGGGGGAGPAWSAGFRNGEAKSAEERGSPRGARISDGAEVEAMLGDAMQARLAAVIDDDDDALPAVPPPSGARKSKEEPWTAEEEFRRKEQEEAKAHAAWMKAQSRAGAKGKDGKPGDANSPSKDDSDGGSESGGSKKDGPPGLGDGWGAPFGASAVASASAGFGGAGTFAGGFGGPKFGRVPTKEDEARLTLEEEQLKAARKEALEYKEQASRSAAHVDMEKQAAEMLRTELASVREQLVAEQEARTKDRQRAEQAEATVEVLKQQLTAFQEQLNRMRKAERDRMEGKDAEHRRLQGENQALLREREEAKTSVMKMWDQLEKKTDEVDALKAKLHGGGPGPSGGPHGPMLGGPGGPGPVQGMRGMPPGPPGQMNGYPGHPNHPGHPGMMQRPPHMQPQQMQRPPQQVMQPPRPQHPGQYGAPPGPHGPGPNGMPPGPPGPPGPAGPGMPVGARPPPGTAAAQVMQRGWKCAHCTFLNQNAPILDPHTKQHKGFCEICEGVTTLFGAS